MRCLAFARYRFLTIIRRLKWVFPAFSIPIILPGALATGILINARNFIGADVEDTMAASAAFLAVVYVVHFLALSALCWSFGVRAKSARSSDLMELVPSRGQARFWGDALGIYAAIMSLHLCMTPMLAAVFVASPFPTSFFWAVELMFAMIFFLISASASRTLRQEAKRWTEISGKQELLLLLCFVLALAGTARLDEFPDAVVAFFTQPSPPAWSGVVAAIANLPLLILLSLALYAGFIAWYSIQTSRAIESA